MSQNTVLNVVITNEKCIGKDVERNSRALN
jgi:hypothetical protein